MPNFNKSDKGFKLNGNPFQKNFPGAFKQAPEMTEAEIQANIERAMDAAEVAETTHMYDEAARKMQKVGRDASQTYIKNLQHIAQRTNNPKHIQQLHTAIDANKQIHGESNMPYMGSWRTDISGAPKDLKIREEYGMPNVRDVLGS